MLRGCVQVQVEAGANWKGDGDDGALAFLPLSSPPRKCVVFAVVGAGAGGFFARGSSARAGQLVLVTSRTSGGGPDHHQARVRLMSSPSSRS